LKVTKLLGARGIRSGLETIAIIGVLLYLNWVLALMLLISAPVLTPLVLSAAKTIKVLSEDVQGAMGNASSAAVEILENQKVIKANQGESMQVARYDGLVESQSSSNTKLIVFQSLLDVSSRLRNVFCVLLTVGLGAHLALMNQVTVGTCYSFFIYGFGFAFALSNVAQSIGEISKAVGALKNCYVVLQEAERESGVQEVDGVEKSLDERVFGADSLDIEFRNVSFSHPDGWKMQDISFKMPAGTMTALVGPSGGGKSTIASLLLGFRKPSSGEIYVNGVPLSSIDVRRWREVVGVVEQKAGLLIGKVKNVVRYGNDDLSDDEVTGVLEAAQALEFVEELGGMDEWVSSGNGSDTLSGGQGQRLALARALARRPKLLVLDEATSALDTETESKLELRMYPTTSLVIAHRLTTVKDCDNIVVVKGGRIVAQGGGPEFFERLGGWFFGDAQV
jgi:subfamily B ATP-binding cassette protein MsbA